MPNIKDKLIELDTGLPIWGHFFTVAPLVVIGTREGSHYDMAPKHMATPLGQGNYFGFICTPRHATYHNVRREGFFTVSFPKPDQVVLASLSAAPRCGDDRERKPILEGLPLTMAPNVDAPFLESSYLFLECEHIKTVDGFGSYSMVCGRITGAYLDEAYQRAYERDEQEMAYRSPLLAFLAYGRFAEIRETFAFPYPKDFKS